MRPLRLPAFFMLLSAIAWGQDAQGTAKTETPAIQFQVLKAWKVDLGDRSIFLNRVVPPVLPQRPAAVVEPAPPPSDEEVQTALRREGKKYELLFLSATVYDRKFSEVSWMDSRHECRIISNIDFNLVRCMGTFESADTVYSLLLAVANKTTANGVIESSGPANGTLVTVAERFPSLEKLSLIHAQYLALESATGALPQEKDLAAMDALHVFFEANRQRLADEYARFEAARIAEESKPQLPKPKPAETIVNFWPGRGTLTIESKGKGLRQ